MFLNAGFMNERISSVQTHKASCGRLQSQCIILNQPKSDVLQSELCAFDYTLLPAALNKRLQNEGLSNIIPRVFFLFLFCPPNGFKCAVIILNDL